MKMMGKLRLFGLRFHLLWFFLLILICGISCGGSTQRKLVPIDFGGYGLRIGVMPSRFTPMVRMIPEYFTRTTYREPVSQETAQIGYSFTSPDNKLELPSSMAESATTTESTSSESSESTENIDGIYYEPSSTTLGYKYDRPDKGYRYTRPTRPPPTAEESTIDAEDLNGYTESPDTEQPEITFELPTSVSPIAFESESENDAGFVFPESTTISSTEAIGDDFWPDGYNGVIPGVAGVDYPIYDKIPETNFDCANQKFSGYYADVEARCQSFHVCLRRTTRQTIEKWSFLCPNGTLFSQKDFVCVWWNHSPSCDDTTIGNLYAYNEALGWDNTGTGQINIKNVMTSMVQNQLHALPVQAIRSPTQSLRNSKSQAISKSKIPAIFNGDPRSAKQLPPSSLRTVNAPSTSTESKLTAQQQLDIQTSQFSQSEARKRTKSQSALFKSESEGYEEKDSNSDPIGLIVNRKKPITRNEESAEDQTESPRVVMMPIKQQFPDGSQKTVKMPVVVIMKNKKQTKPNSFPPVAISTSSQSSAGSGAGSRGAAQKLTRTYLPPPEKEEKPAPSYLPPTVSTTTTSTAEPAIEQIDTDYVSNLGKEEVEPVKAEVEYEEHDEVNETEAPITENPDLSYLPPPKSEGEKDKDINTQYGPPMQMQPSSTTKVFAPTEPTTRNRGKQATSLKKPRPGKFSTTSDDSAIDEILKDVGIEEKDSQPILPFKTATAKTKTKSKAAKDEDKTAEEDDEESNSNLGTATQLYNSNVRAKLKIKANKSGGRVGGYDESGAAHFTTYDTSKGKANKLEEIKAGYVDITNPIADSKKVPPGSDSVQAFLSTEQNLGPKQTLEIHKYALFVPEDEKKSSSDTQVPSRLYNSPKNPPPKGSNVPSNLALPEEESKSPSDERPSKTYLPPNKDKDTSNSNLIGLQEASLYNQALRDKIVQPLLDQVIFNEQQKPNTPSQVYSQPQAAQQLSQTYGPPSTEKTPSKEYGQPDREPQSNQEVKSQQIVPNRAPEPKRPESSYLPPQTEKPNPNYLPPNNGEQTATNSQFQPPQQNGKAPGANYLPPNGQQLPPGVSYSAPVNGQQTQQPGVNYGAPQNNQLPPGVSYTAPNGGPQIPGLQYGSPNPNQGSQGAQPNFVQPQNVQNGPQTPGLQYGSPNPNQDASRPNHIQPVNNFQIQPQSSYLPPNNNNQGSQGPNFIQPNGQTPNQNPFYQQPPNQNYGTIPQQNYAAPNGQQLQQQPQFGPIQGQNFQQIPAISYGLPQQQQQQGQGPNYRLPPTNGNGNQQEPIPNYAIPQNQNHQQIPAMNYALPTLSQQQQQQPNIIPTLPQNNLQTPNINYGQPKPQNPFQQQQQQQQQLRGPQQQGYSLSRPQQQVINNNNNGKPRPIYGTPQFSPVNQMPIHQELIPMPKPPVFIAQFMGPMTSQGHLPVPQFHNPPVQGYIPTNQQQQQQRFPQNGYSAPPRQNFQNGNGNGVVGGYSNGPNQQKQQKMNNFQKTFGKDIQIIKAIPVHHSVQVTKVPFRNGNGNGNGKGQLKSLGGYSSNVNNNNNHKNKNNFFQQQNGNGVGGYSSSSNVRQPQQQYNKPIVNNNIKQNSHYNKQNNNNGYTKTKVNGNGNGNGGYSQPQQQQQIKGGYQNNHKQQNGNNMPGSHYQGFKFVNMPKLNFFKTEDAKNNQQQNNFTPIQNGGGPMSNNFIGATGGYNNNKVVSNNFTPIQSQHQQPQFQQLQNTNSLLLNQMPEMFPYSGKDGSLGIDITYGSPQLHQQQQG